MRAATARENGSATGAAPGGRRRSPRSHDAILRATVDLLQRVGYHGLTMESVAAQAGVGKATIYRWWPSKGALVIEALGRHLAPKPIPDSGDPRKDVRRAVQYASATLLREPVGRIITALAADMMSDPKAAELYREFIRPRRVSAQQALNRAVQDDVLPGDVDVDLLIDMYAGTIFYRVLISGLPVDEKVTDQLASLILDGQLPRARRRGTRGTGARTSARGTTSTTRTGGRAAARTAKQPAKQTAKAASKDAAKQPAKRGSRTTRSRRGE